MTLWSATGVHWPALKIGRLGGFRYLGNGDFDSQNFQSLPQQPEIDLLAVQVKTPEFCLCHATI